jgi:prepilin-type N-terminal cleavage/methylation domain-containing protein
MVAKHSSFRVTGRSRVRGFTLVELLVVVAIIALLLSILLPALNRARDLAITVRCNANLKQIFYTQTLYAADYDDRMVAAYAGWGNTWWPSWPRRSFNGGQSIGLGYYVPFSQADVTSSGQGDGSIDEVVNIPQVFSCPKYAMEVRPRSTWWLRNSFDYALNFWTSMGNNSYRYPPFTAGFAAGTIGLGVEVRPENNSHLMAPTPRMSSFPRPAQTFFASDGDVFRNSDGEYGPHGFTIRAVIREPNTSFNGNRLPYFFDQEYEGGGTGAWQGHLGAMNFVTLGGHVITADELPPTSSESQESWMGGGQARTHPFQNNGQMSGAYIP